MPNDFTYSEGCGCKATFSCFETLRFDFMPCESHKGNPQHTIAFIDRRRQAMLTATAQLAAQEAYDAQ